MKVAALSVKTNCAAFIKKCQRPEEEGWLSNSELKRVMTVFLSLRFFQKS